MLPSSRKSSLTAPLRLTYSIQPVQSLTCSSQLIVDYIADKIEQSVSIQQIFNELLRLFETEALCLGPAFGNTTSVEDVSGLNATHPKANPPKGVLEQPLNSLPSSTDQSQSSDSKASPKIKDFQVSNTSCSDAQRSQRPKILGFRIICSGRLQMSSFSKPAEKAESIELTRGVLPLNTISANIDFAQTYSTNPYGTCGIKVWVNRG